MTLIYIYKQQPVIKAAAPVCAASRKAEKVIQHLFTYQSLLIGPVAKAQKSVRWEIAEAYNWVLAGSKIIGILFYQGLL